MKRITFRDAVGMVIRHRREDMGFSQESFANRVGLHRTYIGAVERGERNVSLDNLLRLSGALDIPLSTLISDAENLIR